MNLKNLGKIVLGWIALVVAQMVAGMIIPVNTPVLPHAFQWLLVTDFLIAGALGFVALRSDWSGWKLAAAITVIPLAINLANLIEGTVFLKHSGIAWPAVFLYTIVTYAIAMPLWRYIFGGREPGLAHYSPFQQKATAMAWKFVVSDVAYLSLYFIAGTVIFPYVKDFYATQSLPSRGTLVALQLLVRGPVFVGLCLLLVRMIGLSRWASAVAVGLAFTILGGVALLLPNPYFPDAVRFVHFGEVTSSNFLFGAIVSLLWGRRSGRAPLEMKHAA